MLARVVLGAVIAQSAFSAAVVTHSWREGSLDLTLDDGSARLEWISPVAFRVFRRWDTGPIDSSQIKHDPVLVALEDAGPVLQDDYPISDGGSVQKGFQCPSAKREHAYSIDLDGETEP